MENVQNREKGHQGEGTVCSMLLACIRINWMILCLRQLHRQCTCLVLLLVTWSTVFADVGCK